jgi:hypothetical protein
MQASASISMASMSASAADNKIWNDLKTLDDKMDLCQSMLNPGAGIPTVSMQSEAMMAVVGFLEACAPRMVELVEAAATGALSEEVFAACLGANDRLQKLLSDVDMAALTETPASTTAAAVGASTTTDDVTAQLDDLLLGDFSVVPTPFGGGAAKEDDDAKLPAISSDDEFDAFFAGRTS